MRFLQLLFLFFSYFREWRGIKYEDNKGMLLITWSPWATKPTEIDQNTVQTKFLTYEIGRMFGIVALLAKTTLTIHCTIPSVIINIMNYILTGHGQKMRMQ